MLKELGVSSSRIISVFHLSRLPNDDIRQKWIDVIEKLQEVFVRPGYFFVCSNHFNQDQLITKYGKTTLRYGAIPSKFDQSVTHAVNPVSIPEQLDEHEINPVSIAEQRAEHLAASLSVKVQALEHLNSTLKNKIESLRSNSADQTKKLHIMEKQINSQQETISKLEQKISDMEAEQWHGVVSVSFSKFILIDSSPNNPNLP